MTKYVQEKPSSSKITRITPKKMNSTVSTQRTVMCCCIETLTSKCSLTKGLPTCPSSTLNAYPSTSPRVRTKTKKRRLKYRLKTLAMTITRTRLVKTSNRESLCRRPTTANHSSISKNSTRSSRISRWRWTMNAQ